MLGGQQVDKCKNIDNDTKYSQYNSVKYYSTFNWLTLNETHAKFTRNKLSVRSDSNIETSFNCFYVLGMRGVRTWTLQQPGTLIQVTLTSHTGTLIHITLTSQTGTLILVTQTSHTGTLIQVTTTSHTGTLIQVTHYLTVLFYFYASS